jgi:hypothetical protein
VQAATHERRATLTLGSTYDYEWSGTSSALADADGADEDAIGSPPPLNYNATINYSIVVSVFNNTGSAATLIAWLDYNFDGLFNTGEGVSINVPTNAAAQSISIPWNAIYVPTTSQTRTFLRLRLTSAANAMTTANVNGYFPDGEVEDFSVILGALLPKDILSVKAEKTSVSNVDLTWSMSPVNPIRDFEVLRSSDSKRWELISTVKSKETSLMQKYKFTDTDPLKGTSYYRIRVNYANNANKFSSIQTVAIDYKNVFLKLSPNPAVDHTQVQFTANKTSDVNVELLDDKGHSVKSIKRRADAGENKIKIDVKNLTPGIYIIQLTINNEKKTAKLFIGRK